MFGHGVMAEDEAEALYVLIKNRINDLDEEASTWFWLKMLWYVKWHAPQSAKERIEEEHCRSNAGGGMRFAHTHRPDWITSSA